MSKYNALLAIALCVAVLSCATGAAHKLRTLKAIELVVDVHDKPFHEIWIQNLCNNKARFAAHFVPTDSSSKQGKSFGFYELDGKSPPQLVGKTYDNDIYFYADQGAGSTKYTKGNEKFVVKGETVPMEGYNIKGGGWGKFTWEFPSTEFKC